MADTNPSRLLSTSTVRPAGSGNHGKKMELSPSDLLTLRHPYIRRGLLFHKPLTNTIDIVERLKEALSRALDIFYPLAGRLAEIKDSDENQTTSFFIDCNDEGALFVHAVADIYTVGDIFGSIIPDEIFSSFFPMSRASSSEPVDHNCALLAVQATELADGVFIACTMNHVVCDGTTLWHFFNVWSEISCLGDKTLPQHPVFGREYLEGLVDLPLRVPNSFLRTPYSTPITTLQRRYVRFSKEKIAELKAKANSGNPRSYVISSLQAVMAHLWVCVTRSRRLNPETLVTYGVSVGLRSRLEQPLSEFYFGNAHIPLVVSTTAGELLDRGMSWAARELNRAIAAQTPGEARKFLENWDKLTRWMTARVTQRMTTPVMITGGSTRFNIYGNDFGWGRPIAVRGPVGPVDGVAPVFPAVEERSIEFELTLSPETFSVLVNDGEFGGTLLSSLAY